MSNFVKIGRSVPELPFFRNPVWRPVAILDSRRYAFGHLSLNRMATYANVENFMPIGLMVHKVERFYYCGVLAKNSLCRVVFWGVLGFPEHKRNCWMFCTLDALIYNKPRRLSCPACLSVDRCGFGVACSVFIGRRGWSFPFWGYLTPRCSPFRISNSAFNPARRDGNFEVFHVVVCHILHIRDVAYCWNSFIMGNPYSRSNFGQFWGITPVWRVVCRPDPQKAHPCVRTRILSHHAPFYDSPFGLGVNLRKLVKNKNKKKSHNRSMSPLCPLKPASRIGMGLRVSVEADDVIN
jgi:hypothetical protein